MGYRLNIYDVKNDNYIVVNKLFGYVSIKDTKKLESYKYLKGNDILSETELDLLEVGMLNDDNIRLSYNQFVEFWKRYLYDCNLFPKDFPEVEEYLDTHIGDDIFITWG